jgi:GPH family glycoside/pentoside/hexuronide:cation symporter
VLLLLAFVVGSVGRTVNASVALFYYQHRLGLDERQVFLHVLLPFTLFIALSIGAWLRLARWLGRKAAASGGILLLGLGTSVAYPLFPSGRVGFPLAAAIVGGLLVGAVFLLDATVADLVDSDRLHTGRHREGLYFGVWRTATKLARALGLLASGLMLESIGFVPREAAQAPGVDLRLALVFGPGVGAFFIAAALLYLAMPFDEARAARVRRLLARRAERGSLTGGRREAPGTS